MTSLQVMSPPVEFPLCQVEFLPYDVPTQYQPHEAFGRGCMRIRSPLVVLPYPRLSIRRTSSTGFSARRILPLSAIPLTPVCRMSGMSS